MNRKTKEQSQNDNNGQKEHLIKHENAKIELKRVLREPEEMYRFLLEGVPIGIGISDLNGNFTDANRYLQEMTGYSLEELRKLDAGVIFHDQDEYRSLFESLKKFGKINDREIKLNRKDGTIHSSLLNADILESRSSITVLMTVQDAADGISQEKKLKEAIEKANSEKNKSDAIIAALGDGIIIQDKNYRIIYQNQIQKESHGDRNGELCYKAYENRDSICEDCPVEKTLSDGKIHISERRISTENGVFYYELTSSPLRDSAGNIIAGIKVVRDITERKRVEEKLREGERFLESVFASIQDGLGIIDNEMNIIRVNKTAYSWYPFSAPFVGKKCYEAYHNRKERCEECPAWETLKTGKSAHRTVTKHGKSGNVIGWLEIYSFPLIDTKTQFMKGVIEYVRDITERKIVEKALLESETRYRTLFESAGDAIFILEAQGDKGHIVDANSAAAQMHGYSINELLELNIKDLDTKEYSEKSHAYIERILEGETLKVEMDHRRKDGTVFPVEIIARVLELGGHKYILAFDRDVSKRKRAEEALRLSNLVVENSLTVLFRWKAKEGWPVEYVSNNIVQFGYRPEEFLSGSLPYASIIHPDDIERVFREIEEHSKNGDERFQQEYRIIAKNGTIHWIDDRTVIERNSDEKITNFQGIIIDITERKKAEEAIRNYNFELEESNRMKELFTDIMHHDLLNPLNIANSYVEIILDNESNPLTQSYLEIIKRNLVKGMDLIDNATKFSKLESLKSIEFKDMDLRKIICECIDNLTPLVINAGMSIENNLPYSMPVKANKIIEDIFSNIISNAIKYTRQGKRVVIDGIDDGNFWMIRIKDFGAGIKDSDKKLIFKRFHREEKKGVKGSGLGLAIAGMIIELHKGRIWVEDNSEGGAIFVVEIPKN